MEPIPSENLASHQNSVLVLQSAYQEQIDAAARDQTLLRELQEWRNEVQEYYGTEPEFQSVDPDQKLKNVVYFSMEFGDVPNNGYSEDQRVAQCRIEFEKYCSPSVFRCSRHCPQSPHRCNASCTQRGRHRTLQRHHPCRLPAIRPDHQRLISSPRRP
jgi:hypothetical protein